MGSGWSNTSQINEDVNVLLKDDGEVNVKKEDGEF